MSTRTLASILLTVALAGGAAQAQATPQPASAPTASQPAVVHAAPPQLAESPDAFGQASTRVQARLGAALAELRDLQQQAAEQTLPLSRMLSELESELIQARRDYEQAARQLDNSKLVISNLRNEIKSRHDEVAFLSDQLNQYVRKLEPLLHIAELQRYREPLEAARLAPENDALTAERVLQTQAKLVDVSVDRLMDALGGTRFAGQAVDENGMVKPGTFLVMGPAALFRSDDGVTVGTAEQRLGSLEPTVVPFADPAQAAAAAELVAEGSGQFPLDPTLGNAHKIEQTEETLLEHIQKGGPVMYPILGMAAAALLVALYKWISLSLVRRPSAKQLRGLLAAVERDDRPQAVAQARQIKGPAGTMLQAGAAHLHEPRELIEEIMYETVLATQLKLRTLLPFIAIAASSAPLLGLLGTVTGIINTFKLITVFGSGDVKMLSGGISEALITTEFGLIVAIPSLLLHAFLSRKARAIADDMEKAAIAFANQAAKVHPTPDDGDVAGGRGVRSDRDLLDDGEGAQDNEDAQAPSEPAKT